MINRGHLLAGLSLFALITSAASPALAQAEQPSTPTADQQADEEQVSGADATPAAAESESPDIIVTARLRQESLQDVPLAITAFTARQIQDAGIDSVEDIARLTPGFTFTPLFGGPAATPVIRGLSTTIGEPNVGFFVDGVYQSSRTVMDAMLLGDIARVEVVRGPQSALYGRNTFGGAINYITVTPTNDFTGRAEATIGEHEQREVRGYVRGPLVGDTLYFNLGASYAHRGGYWQNTLTGRDLDDYSSLILSGGLELRPAEGIRLRVRGAYESTDQGDFPIAFAPNTIVPANPTGNPAFPAVFQLAGGDLPEIDQFARSPGFNNRDFFTGAFIADIELGRLTLTSITGLTDLRFRSATDLDYEARRIRFQTQDIDTREFSQELRIVSPADGPVSFLAGAYYYNLDQDSFIDDRLDADALPTATLLSSSPAFAGVRRQLQGGVATQLSEGTESFALFGQITVRPTDRLSLTAEGRQTWETKSVSATDTQQIGGAVGTFSDDVDFRNFVPRFTADYRASDNLMLYASAARAVKVGGFNVVTVAGAIPAAERTYDPESSWTYEAGVKTTWLGGNLLLNADVFRIDWSNQIVRAIGTTGALLNVNAGATRSQGFELEGRLRAAQGLELSGGLAYIDAEYQRYNFGILSLIGLNPDLSGVDLQYVSKWQANGAVQYRAPLTESLSFFGRADVAYQARQSAVQPGLSFLGPATTMNVRVGFDYQNVQVRLFVENLTNEQDPAAAAYVPSAGARYNWALGAIGAAPRVGLQLFNAAAVARQERHFGVSVGYRF